MPSLDAIAPMRAGAARRADQFDFDTAATGYGNLSELLVLTGRLKGPDGALTAAAKGLDCADQTKSAPRQTVAAALQATASFAAGDLAQSEAHFRWAENRHGERLYSLRGFHYCSLLMARGRTSEASDRASKALALARKQNWGLDAALAHLTLARVAPSVESTRTALAALRRADAEPMLPPAAAY